jgi:hypothetical protein
VPSRGHAISRLATAAAILSGVGLVGSRPVYKELTAAVRRHRRVTESLDLAGFSCAADAEGSLRVISQNDQKVTIAHTSGEDPSKG